MAYEEYIKKAVETGKRYEDLPERIRAILPLAEWTARVREICIQQGLAWNVSMATTVCSEQEYYEELVRKYKGWGRLYPYHLAEYVARVLRVTPFKYYTNVLFLNLKEERSYDRIPNFTAADALRLTGVGRNEYIAIMNACKAKKLMWRVSKGIARDLLPSLPKDSHMEHWWQVAVVNVGAEEFRELSTQEAALLRQAVESSGAAASLSVAACDPDLLQSLYKRGIIYLHVPVTAADRISVRPLEGFVSNKTSEAGDESVDPLEVLLYSLFLANSSRLSQAQLADILGVRLEQLLPATSLALRLGFATKQGMEAEEGSSASSTGLTRGSTKGSGQLTIPDNEDNQVLPTASTEASTSSAGGGSSGAATRAWVGAGAGNGGGGAIAVMVDAEATGYLMMGALSPGLKRHSVTLFEGGRVAGAAVIDELISELAASATAGAGFEGDMVQLVHYIESLKILLGVVRDAAAAEGQQLELLRKESLAGLDPLSAAKVLCHAYTAIIPIAPMPAPALPVSPISPNAPAFFGPTPEADSPWLQLALYAAAGRGPVSMVFVAGQRVCRLPEQLQGCTHALLWGWARSPGSANVQPLLVGGTSLLCTLNEMLCRTAVLLQPLMYNHQLPADPAAADSSEPLVAFADVPLPLRPSQVGATPVSSASRKHAASATGSEPQEAGSMNWLAADIDALQLGSSKSTQLNASSNWQSASPADESTNRSVSTLQQWQHGATMHQQDVQHSQSYKQQQQQHLSQQQQQQQQPDGDIQVVAVHRLCSGGQLQQLVLPNQIVAALRQLYLESAVGWIRLVRLPQLSSRDAAGDFAAAGSQAASWVPLSIDLGVPLFCPVLCQQVCNNMCAAQCLTSPGRASWHEAQVQLQQVLGRLIAQSWPTSSKESNSNSIAAHGSASSSQCDKASGGTPSTAPQSGAANNLQVHPVLSSSSVELPASNMVFAGSVVGSIDLHDCMQGSQLW